MAATSSTISSAPSPKMLDPLLKPPQGRQGRFDGALTIGVGTATPCKARSSTAAPSWKSWDAICGTVNGLTKAVCIEII